MNQSCPRCDRDHVRGSLDCPGARVGQIIAGRYQLENLLGVGGMGAVYRARHLALRAPVAIKMLHPRFTTAREFVQRFLREAQAAATLKHPGFVDVTDFGSAEDGSPYMVMELLEGESLQRLLERGPLPIRQAVNLTVQVLQSLAVAHDAGVVHRDLKPENLFLARRHDLTQVRILDFGIAKVTMGGQTEGLTQTGQMMGTPVYMSREQLEDFKGVDHRTDIYSMGAVLFHLLTGQAPLQRGTTPPC